MALVTEDLRTWLLDQAAIEALLEDRVYALRLQQKSKMPAAVLSLVSTVTDMSTRGFSRRRVRRIQIDLYSADLDEVYTLGETVFRALVGFSGEMGTTHVQSAFMLSERDIDEPEVELFRRIQDWELAESG